MSSAVPSAANAPRRLDASSIAWPRLAPWLLFGLALATRFFGVAADGLRTDEMYSVWMASRPLPEMLAAIVIDGHDATPPAFYVLLHFALHASWELWSIRLVSIVAGALMVPLTFAFAQHLFDFRTAALAALLLAVAPYSIDVSQVARAYTLSGLLALASLYFFARMAPESVSRRSILFYVLATLGALATHYLAALVIVFQNLVVLLAFLLRWLRPQRLLAWIKLQALMGVLALPLAWMALQRLPASGSGTGQDWLPSPGATVIIKSLILWGSGDPSFGGMAFTIGRLASLGVIAALLAVGAASAWRLWRSGPGARSEVAGAALVASAFFGIWGIALGISLQRKIFHEKYFIYLAALLIVLLVWSGLRARPAWLGRGLLASLFVLTGLALNVQYSSPSGEQWREAMAWVAPQRQPGDLVVTTPGYYVRPVSYYLTGKLPPVDYRLLRAPFAVVTPDGFEAAGPPTFEADLPGIVEIVEPASRVWLVTGYAAVEPSHLDWFWENYTTVHRQEFLGVDVVLGESMPLESAIRSAPLAAGRWLPSLPRGVQVSR
jgi:hypothetical protein